MNELTECATCKGSLAALAAVCPHCGAPSTYVHPNIQLFLKQKDTIPVAKPFTFHHDKLTLRGETKETRTTAWWVVVTLSAGLILLQSVFFGAGLGFTVILCMAAIVFAQFKLMHKEWFRANLATREWQSSNEEFWKPVRAMLEL